MIADINSTDAVLLKSTLASAASVTSPLIGVAGVVTNEVTTTFTVDGFNASSGGDLCSISFSNLDPDDRLAYEGQIVMDVSTNNCCGADEAAIVTQTQGIALAAAQYLFALENSIGTDLGSCFVSGANQLTSKLYSTDTQLTPIALTNDKSGHVTLCWWWKGNEWGILADGGELLSGTRQTAHPADSFYKIVLGTAFNGTGNPFENGRIKNLIISYVSPRLQNHPIGTLSILGDSYAVQLSTANAASYYDLNDVGLVGRYLSKRGQSVRIYSDGTGGASICDTGALDLSSSFTTWVQNSSGVVWLLAFNNDATASSANRNNVTTGTDANIKDLLEKMGGETAVAGHTYNNVSKVIIARMGSLTNNESIDTAANQTGQAEVQAIIDALPAWWDATYPAKAGFVEVYDLFNELGGDSLTNRNYAGYLESLGNLTQAPVSPQADRHPSSWGRIKIAQDLCKLTF